ncbi:MAG: glycosyltransferase [Patescibacteria group bacterium]
MKIVLINNKEISGGSAQVCQELIHRLEKDGLTTTFFCAHKKSAKNNVIPLKNQPWKKLLSYLTSNDLDHYDGRELIETAEFRKADIIHLHNISGHFFPLPALTEISRLKPVIWTFHDMQPINHYFAHSFEETPKDGLFTGASPKKISNLIWWNRQYLKKRKISVYQKSNFQIVSPSSWLAAKVKMTALTNKPIEIINNGIDADIFSPGDKTQAKLKVRLPTDKKIILTISDRGRNNILKGWDFIRQLADHWPEILFISIGNDIRGKEKNIYFEKEIYDKNILKSYYQAADLLLLPSLAENFPLTSLEAMACGTPVVAFAVGGLNEQISHQLDGYLAKTLDIDDLINGINFIYAENSEKISKRCRYKVEKKFSAADMFKKYLDLYKRTIKEHENRH